MNLHLGIHELAARHRLDGPGQQRLRELAEIDTQPPAASRWMPVGAAIGAATLFGLGATSTASITTRVSHCSNDLRTTAAIRLRVVSLLG